MSDRPLAARLAGLVRGRTPLVLAAAPLLFVYFGLFLPVASAAGFPAGFAAGAGVIFAAAGAAVFSVERWLAHAHALGTAAQVREFVAIEVGAALFAWMLLPLPPAALVRTGGFWAAVLAAGLVFALSAAVRRRTARQEFFRSAVARMATAEREGPESDVVSAVTRELSVEAGESAAALTSLRRWLIFFILWLVALLVVTGWVLQVASVAEQIGICASTMVFLSGLVSVGRLREEQRVLTLGLVPERRHRQVEAGLAGVLFVAAALLSGVLAARHALVSRATLAAIGSWILRLLSRLPSHHAAPAVRLPPPRAIPHQIPELPQRLRDIAPLHGSPLVAEILTYLAWGVAAAAAAGFLWLLFAPLFRIRGRGVSPASVLQALRRRIAGAVRRWASELRSAFTGAREARGSGRRGPGPVDVRRRGSGRRRRSRRPHFGAGGMRRFSGAFRRLARWGGDRGAVFAPSLGPREYTSLLAARVPGVRTELERIAELYERQLFSPIPLSGPERASYFNLIKEVVRSGST